MRPVADALTTAVVAAAVVALAAAGCAGSARGDRGSAGSGDVELPRLEGQTVEVVGPWTGGEQRRFQKVLDTFARRTGATVNFTSTGNMTTYLGSQVRGGTAPDVAIIAQPGVVRQFAEQGALKPVSAEVERAVDENFPKVWKDLASVDGKLYGVYFKATDKSMVWYRPEALRKAGVLPPRTWEEFVKAAEAVAAAGQPPVQAPVSIGAADPWTLTDWFENVYLSQAGPRMYDKLTRHQIPWTDPSVKKALRVLAQIWSRPELITGGTAGALRTNFTTSVLNTFGDAPKAAMVYEGDFVGGKIAGATRAKVGLDAKFFPFPAVGSESPVVVAGDEAVAFKSSRGAMALLRYMASVEAAEIWVREGGFISPNRKLDILAYPDDTTRGIAVELFGAGDNLRFDMSDLAPGEFGGAGGVEWREMREFFRKPYDVDGVTTRLEAAAAASFKR